MGPDGNRTVLQTTATSLEIVEQLASFDGAGVAELGRALDLAPSTVHAHLSTLLDEEFVVKEGDVYYLGTRFLRLGEYVRTRTEAYERAEEYASRLVEETGCRSVFMIEEHGLGTFLHARSGDHSAWTHADAGKRTNLHVTAAGKAILAHLPEDRMREIVETRGLPERTAASITDESALFEELEDVRSRGIAVNRGENIEGVRAVGAPVHVSDRIVGAFSVSGPANHLTGPLFEEKLPETLLAVTNEFELELQLT